MRITFDLFFGLLFWFAALVFLQNGQFVLSAMEACCGTILLLIFYVEELGGGL